MGTNITPKQAGYHMPAEWEKQRATYMLWPTRRDNWREGAVPAQKVFAQIANIISKYQRVVMGVDDVYEAEIARRILSENVQIAEIPNDDSWARDNGFTCVVNGNDVRAVNFAFNAWGHYNEKTGKVEPLYEDFERDKMVSHRMAENAEIESFDAYHFVLEGGSIHTDGQGTILTTEECLLNKGRNGHLTKEEIEEELKEYLGGKKVIWIPKGIYDDETSGHVDNMCCFVAPGEVALAWPNDNYPQDDPQWERSKSAYEVLQNTTDAKGRMLKIHKILLPDPIIITETESKGIEVVEGTLPRNAGDRLAASYINFYIANGVVVIPAFRDPQDNIAKEQIQKLFPDRDVIQIENAREILLGGGNIHCITQQLPSAGNKEAGIHDDR